MKDKIVIPKGNKKAVSIINDLLNAKTALREFIAKGGKAKNFRVTTSGK